MCCTLSHKHNNSGLVLFISCTPCLFLSITQLQYHLLSKWLQQQQVSNSLRLRQNGRRFADDNFECIFLNENVRILIKISLKFVPEGPINNIPSFVQKMACADQATSHHLNQWWLVYRRIYASLSLNELNITLSIYSMLYYINVFIDGFNFNL